MTKKQPNEWAELVEGARHQVERAREGDYLSAMEIVSQSAIALRGLLRHNDPPDPYRRVYLEGLLAGLERIEAGEEPTDALSLRKPPHRIANPNIAVRDALVFVLIGEELDRLNSGRGTLAAPTRTALENVAARRRMSVAKVQKVWTEHGAVAGWERHKSDWK